MGGAFRPVRAKCNRKMRSRSCRRLTSACQIRKVEEGIISPQAFTARRTRASYQ